MDREKHNHIQACRAAPDPGAFLWSWIVREAQQAHATEMVMADMLEDVCLSRSSLADAVAVRMARKLSRRDMSRDLLEPLMRNILLTDAYAVASICEDILAILTRDPACHSPLEALLFFKGFHAICTHRMAHHLWMNGRHLLALQFQSASSEVFGVDIHPAASIGKGILLDHATGIVVGETAIIKDNVSILHEVTLGGTGKEQGARHPIVESCVLIGAGAKILGRVTIGTGAKIAASSVVLTDVPPHATAAGVPAVIIGTTHEVNPALEMNQSLTCD